VGFERLVVTKPVHRLNAGALQRGRLVRRGLRGGDGGPREHDTSAQPNANSVHVRAGSGCRPAPARRTTSARAARVARPGRGWAHGCALTGADARGPGALRTDAAGVSAVFAGSGGALGAATGTGRSIGCAAVGSCDVGRVSAPARWLRIANVAAPPLTSEPS